MVQLVSSSGTVTKTYKYDAFGVEYNSDANDTNYFRYCGQYFDTESGTYYLRARYYDPANGRFTQQDGWQYGDINDPLSLNLYCYFSCNPVNYFDFSGNDAVLVCWRSEWGGGGLPVVGHTFLLLKGSDGKWYLAEFAGKYPWTAETRLYEMPENFNYEEYLSSLEGQVDYVYLKGDYDASIELARMYRDGELNYGRYVLFYHNCCDYVQLLLAAGSNASPIVQTYIVATFICSWNTVSIPIIFFEGVAAIVFMTGNYQNSSNNSSSVG